MKYQKSQFEERFWQKHNVFLTHPTSTYPCTHFTRSSATHLEPAHTAGPTHRTRTRVVSILDRFTASLSRPVLSRLPCPYDVVSFPSPRSFHNSICCMPKKPAPRLLRIGTQARWPSCADSSGRRPVHARVLRRVLGTYQEAGSSSGSWRLAMSSAPARRAHGIFGGTGRCRRPRRTAAPMRSSAITQPRDHMSTMAS
jgi:hypothetical protein